MKYIDIKEFHESGLLQEVNRKFFHPRGLALEVFVEADGTGRIGGIRDYRDDPEGCIFGQDCEPTSDKAEHALYLFTSKVEARKKALGYVVQPLRMPESMVKTTTPTTEGLHRYPALASWPYKINPHARAGYYYDDPCTCTPACDEPCEGEALPPEVVTCHCRACTAWTYDHMEAMEEYDADLD